MDPSGFEPEASRVQGGRSTVELRARTVLVKIKREQHNNRPNSEFYFHINDVSKTRWFSMTLENVRIFDEK